LLVGIVETNKELGVEIAKRFGFSEKLFFPSIEVLRQKLTFRPLRHSPHFRSPSGVEICAHLGIHVMLEKPMAVDIGDAQALAASARKGGIKVVVNYETSWYPSTHHAYELVHQQRAIGEVRKIVIHDGHSGRRRLARNISWIG